MKTKKHFIDILGSFIARHPFIYYLLTYTWGLVMTVIGWLIVLVLLIFRKGRLNRLGYHIFFEFHEDKSWGFSIGSISFVGKIFTHADKELLLHEFGHTVQNALFGPLVLFIVYIPSFIRYHYIEYLQKTAKDHKVLIDFDYEDIWFESNATRLGYYWLEEYIGRRNR